WSAKKVFGLFHVRGERLIETISWDRFAPKRIGIGLAADRRRRGIWIGFYEGGLVYHEDGRVRESYDARSAPGLSEIFDLRSDPDGALWITSATGLSRLKDGRLITLNARNGLPCDAIHWTIEDDAHAVWLQTPCGLARIERAEIDARVAALDANNDASDGPRAPLPATLFQTLDGAATRSTPGNYHPLVTKASDGTLWFAPFDGVSFLDPRHVPFNALKPPVHVEQMTADRHVYDIAPGASATLALPPLVRDLRIDYTALSLVAPEKIRFRYKLENWDRDWQNVGNRPQPFYNNLAPGPYRFRVSAANNSGVWNEAGAFVDFSVAPAYYQTAWFRLALLAAVITALIALYQWRLRQVANAYNVRLEERVNERTRIARDLHDTLLQSFQGVLLRFHAATYLLPDRPAEALETLESAIDQAAQAVTEGRDAVQGLRASAAIGGALAEAICSFGQELVSSNGGAPAPDVRVNVEGTPQDLA